MQRSNRNRLIKYLLTIEATHEDLRGFRPFELRYILSWAYKISYLSVGIHEMLILWLTID
jgi:hypothetical protein